MLHEVVSISNKKFKAKLHARNPYCYWCGRETKLLEISQMSKGAPDSLMATIDHLYSRLNPMRWVKAGANERRKVLSCWECNHRRGKKEVSELSKEEGRNRGNGFCLNPKGKNLFKETYSTIDEVINTLEQNGILSSTSRVDH